MAGAERARLEDNDDWAAEGVLGVGEAVTESAAVRLGVGLQDGRRVQVGGEHAAPVVVEPAAEEVVEVARGPALLIEAFDADVVHDQQVDSAQEVLQVAVEVTADGEVVSGNPGAGELAALPGKFVDHAPDAERVRPAIGLRQPAGGDRLAATGGAANETRPTPSRRAPKPDAGHSSAG